MATTYQLKDSDVHSATASDGQINLGYSELGDEDSHQTFENYHPFSTQDGHPGIEFVNVDGVLSVGDCSSPTSVQCLTRQYSSLRVSPRENTNPKIRKCHSVTTINLTSTKHNPNFIPVREWLKPNTENNSPVNFESTSSLEINSLDESVLPSTQPCLKTKDADSLNNQINQADNNIFNNMILNSTIGRSSSITSSEIYPAILSNSYSKSSHIENQNNPHNATEGNDSNHIEQDTCATDNINNHNNIHNSHIFSDIDFSPKKKLESNLSVRGSDPAIYSSSPNIDNNWQVAQNPNNYGARKSRQDSTFSKLSAEKSPSQSFCSKYSSCRWQLAYMCFMARFVQTALRQCMGFAVIGMTLRKRFRFSLVNVTMNSTDPVAPDAIPDFAWSSAFEGMILASFNMGSIITPIIIGYLTTRYGGRKLMTLCFLAGGIFTVLLPVAATADPALIILFRILTGIAMSGTDSLIQAMLARWAPLYEKASLSACSYTGLSIAGVTTFMVCGYLVSIGGEGKGWPYIFYLFGSMSLLMAPVWYWTVHNSPGRHPRISKTELAIITFNKRPERFTVNKKDLKIPWCSIFRSSAVWVIIMGHITHKWVLSFMLSYLPRYFSDLFDFDMKTDGLFSSLPFAGRVVSGVVAGYLSDWMLRRGVATGRTRKIFQAVGCWGCAALSLAIAFTPRMSNASSITLLVLALSCQDLTSVAFRINLLDIAPRYAGLLNGLAATIATLTSLPVPVITSVLISGGSRHGWQVIFGLVVVLNIVGGITFVIFAKGEIQDWAVEQPRRKPSEKTVVFSLEANRRITYMDQEPTSHRPVRVARSLPVNERKYSIFQKLNVSRRATFDGGSLTKLVHSQAFSNMAMADL